MELNGVLNFTFLTYKFLQFQMPGHDLVFFLNAFIRVQSVKIRGLIIWLRLGRAVLIRG